jgi:hypothetical protein
MGEITELGLKDLIRETVKSLKKINDKELPSGKEWVEDFYVYDLNVLQDQIREGGFSICESLGSDVSEINRKINSSRPNLSQKHSSKEVQEYSVKFKEYESLKRKQDEIKRLTKSIDAKVSDAMYGWVKAVCGLDKIPEQYQGKVWVLAWDRGHGCGINEVKMELENLIDIFE